MKKIELVNPGIDILLNKSKSGLLLLDLELNIIDCNQAFLRIYAYKSLEKVSSKSFPELFFKNEAKELVEKIIPVVRENSVWTGELYGKKSDGACFLHKLTLTLNPEDTYLVLVQEKEMSLSKGEGHSCTMFNNLSDGFFKITTAGECICLNPVLSEILAYNNKSKIEKENFFKDIVIKIKENKDRKSFIKILNRKNGELLWIEIKYWEIRDREGNILYYEGLIKDISKEQGMMEELKKNEKKYRALFQNTGTAILVINEDTTITMVNRKMEELSGYSKNDIEGKMSWMQFVAEEELEKMLQNHNKRRYSSIRDRVPKSYEFRFKTKNGEIKDVICTVVLLKNSLETIISIIDISERKNYEQRIAYLAYHDKLTGLYNRDYFEEKIRELDKDDSYPLSIIMGDVNSLKLTNDAFGHKKGDELLKIIAGILKKACRDKDIICRWGGDEFLIILPNTDYNEANKLRKKIHQYCIQVKDELIQPSMALGIETKTEEEQDIKEIINNAEKWLYKNKLLESKSVRSSILRTLEETLLEKDFETEEHAKRVKELARKMGRALNLSNDKIDDLILLASLHDIGKIAISDKILLKPGSLSKNEWEQIKKHSEIGYRIIKSSPELASIADGILHHHEWWDGSGYPTGLSDKDIPLSARIITIIDSYDVMIHDRVYKKAMTPEEAVIELRRCAGIQFDPELVQVFINSVVDTDLISNKKLA